MSKRKMWLLLIVPVVLLAAAEIHGRSGPVWDYSYCGLEKPRDMKLLYDLGDEGWED